VLYAKALATPKSASDESYRLTVTSCTYSAASASVGCQGSKSLAGYVSAGTPVGTTITIYANTGSVLATTTTTSAGGSGNSYDWFYACNGSTSSCNSGPNCATPLAGGYYITVTESGKCESVVSAYICVTGGGATTAPVITTPVNASTTTISGTASAGNQTIHIYKNGYRLGTVTSAATSPFSWSLSGQSFVSTDDVTAVAVLSGSCFSSSVHAPTNAPVVSSPILAGASSVTGTSVEAQGTSITVYKNVGGSISSLGNTTVNQYGNWTLSGLSGLAATNIIYATATATNKSVSANSNNVTVQAAATAITLSITGSYTEAGTTVKGTVLSGGPLTGKVKLYIDDVLIDSVSVTSLATGGIWTISTLSASSSAINYLYAGGTIKATATPTTGATEGAKSAGVVVQCVMPVAKTYSGAASCQNSEGKVIITNSEPNVIYTLRNSANTADAGPSGVGTGSNLTLYTFVQSSAGTVSLKVAALKISSASCSNTMSGTATDTVYGLPSSNLALSAASNSISYNTSTFIMVNSSQSGISYQLRNNANNANVGPTVTGNGGTISLPTGNLTATTVFNVLAIDATHNTNCSAQLVSGTQTIAVFTPLPVELISFKASCRNTEVVLDWTTASELNNDYFTIEKSDDGINFLPVKKVPGHGTYQGILNYQATDVLPFANTYYRLKQTDFNGDFTYSHVVMVRPQSSLQTYELMSIAPNPGAAESVTVTFNTEAGHTYQLIVLDETGRIRGRTSIASSGSRDLNSIVSSALNPGIYTLQMVSDTETFSRKLIITGH
jgi:hypothetical protein